MKVDPFAPEGMFYIAGELDKNIALGIDYEKDANSLSAGTSPPSKVIIVERTAEHGVALLESNSVLITDAIQWVRDL